MGIIVFLLILSILILVHEFGHFIAAKKNGVKVEEFGLGFPPRIFSKKIGETIYSINLLPLGGFVKVYGEEYHEKTKNKNRAFVYKKPWQKALIIISGVIGNLLLAWVLLSFLATQGIQVPTNKVVIEEVQKNTPAQEAGLKVGDTIKAIKFENKVIVVKKPEDLIAIANNKSGKEMLLSVENNKGIERFVRLTARKNYPKNQGPLGIAINGTELKKYSIFEAPIIGFKFSLKYLILILAGFGELLKSLFTFHKPSFEVAGPIGIAQFTGQALKIGQGALIEFTAALSLNLAVLNIFPFPALDGGRLAFVVYEWITKKQINKNFERSVNSIGMIILLSFVFIITINDIIRIFR